MRDDRPAYAGLLDDLVPFHPGPADTALLHLGDVCGGGTVEVQRLQLWIQRVPPPDPRPEVLAIIGHARPSGRKSATAGGWMPWGRPGITPPAPSSAIRRVLNRGSRC